MSEQERYKRLKSAIESKAKGTKITISSGKLNKGHYLFYLDELLLCDTDSIDHLETTVKAFYMGYMYWSV